MILTPAADLQRLCSGSEIISVMLQNSVTVK